jgi:hypothetical protein
MNVRNRNQVLAKGITLGNREPVMQVKPIDGSQYQTLGT